MKNLTLKRRPGQALVEVVVAMGMLVIFASGFVRLAIGSHDGSRQARQQTIATLYAQEALEASRSIAERDFSALADGTHGLDSQLGWYELSGASDIIGKYTRTLTIEPVQRDGNDDIIASGGTADDSTKTLTSEVTWNVSDGRDNTVSLFMYITDWANQMSQWIMDLASDFDTGMRNGTVVTQNDDGEVSMDLIGDFSIPELSFTANASGSGDPSEMHIDERSDRLYITTSVDPAAAEFQAYDISNVSADILTLTGSVELGETSNGFALGNEYAYVLTNGNSSEIAVVRLSDLTIVATWDIPSDSDPNDIAIDEAAGRAYVVTDNSVDDEFYILNISSPAVASIQIVDQGEISANALSVDYYSGYGYVGTDTAGSELVIITLSDPNTTATCNLTGAAALNELSIKGTSLFVGHAGGGASEFTEYSINPAAPNDCLYITGNVIGGTNLGTDDVTGMYIDTVQGYAFISLASATDELQVIDLTTFVASQLDLTGSFCDAVTFLGGFIYAGCRDNTATLQVIEGAQEGGWAQLQLVGDGNVLSGNPSGNSVAATNTALFLGTTDNASGEEFFVFSTTPTSGMVPIGSLEIGGDVNDIMVVGDYAYLATSHNSQEMIIVDISTPSTPSIAGTFNTVKSTDGLSVFVAGSYVYLGTEKEQKDEEFFVIDTSNLASISEVGSYEVGDSVNSIVITGTTAFIATPSNSKEFISLNVASPASITQLDAENSPSNSNGQDLLLDGTILYAITQDDLYVYDVSNPSAITQLATFDYNNDLVALALSTDSSYLFLATDTGGFDVRVFDVSTPASIVETASLSLNGQPNDAFFLNDTIYLASSDNTQKLQILKKGDAAIAYPRWATFTSPDYDSDNASASWNEIAWTQSGSGSLTFRVRVGSTLANLHQGVWVGSDGTIDTVYDQDVGQAIITDPGATGTRWFQWKAYFEGDGAGTTILEDVTVTY